MREYHLNDFLNEVQKTQTTEEKMDTFDVILVRHHKKSSHPVYIQRIKKKTKPKPPTNW